MKKINLGGVNMKIIPFNDICDYDFNIHHIFAKRQQWHDTHSYSYSDSPRRFHCFLYLKSCCCTVKCGSGKIIYAYEGDMLYVPKNSFYSIDFKNIAADDYNTYLVNFLIDDTYGNSICFSDDIVRLPAESIENAYEYINETVTQYEMISNSPAMLKCCMYNVCYNIGMAYRTKISRIRSKEYCIISKGVEYIENNLDGIVSIDTAAELCAVSAGCFRRLFKKYAGCPPKEYIINKKLLKSKELLKSGMYDINEISELLGFGNPSYFSRIFKKKTGYTPSEYIINKNIEKQL